MAEGYVGQIFNSVQGEGVYVGRRQVFVRFSGCRLNCLYCDTKEFREFQPDKCMVETKPGSMKFKRVPNPMTPKKVLLHVKHLRTPDTHSVSLTGGEPLQAGDFMVDVARACSEARFTTYLETAGTSSWVMEEAVRWVNIAAVDIKLPDHRAVPRSKWPHLLEEELNCIKIALRGGVKTFAKIVALSSTQPKIVSYVCEQLERIGKVPVVIQPVTQVGKGYKAPSMAQVYKLAEAAAQAGVKEIAIIPQVHRLIGVL